MSSLRHTFIGLAALLVVAPRPAQAQQWINDHDGWIGISYTSEVSLEHGRRHETLVIEDVVDGSPADRAGLQRGDVLLRVNGVGASQWFMSSFSSALAPGDTVRLRVQRDERERDVTLIAGRRPDEYRATAGRRTFTVISPDSIRGVLRMYIDSARVHMDSLHLPDIVLRYPQMDSLPLLMHGDSIVTYQFSPADSLGWWMVRPDSLVRRFRVFSDSTLFQPDSLDRRFRFGLFGQNNGEMGDMPFGGITILGDRGVAGAELTRIEAGLGDYFGTSTGILVLRVADRTPAATAGLRPGDVIVRADGEAVASVAELRRIVSESARGNAVKLDILRKKQPVTLELAR